MTNDEEELDLRVQRKVREIFEREAREAERLERKVKEKLGFILPKRDEDE